MVGDSAEITFSIEVGRLFRGQARRELKSYCFVNGLELSIDEDRGFLESLLLVKMDVPQDKVPQVRADLRHWLEQYA